MHYELEQAGLFSEIKSQKQSDVVAHITNVRNRERIACSFVTLCPKGLEVLYLDYIGFIRIVFWTIIIVEYNGPMLNKWRQFFFVITKLVHVLSI